MSRHKNAENFMLYSVFSAPYVRVLVEKKRNPLYANGNPNTPARFQQVLLNARCTPFTLREERDGLHDFILCGTVQVNFGTPNHGLESGLNIDWTLSGRKPGLMMKGNGGNEHILNRREFGESRRRVSQKKNELPGCFVITFDTERRK